MRLARVVCGLAALMSCGTAAAQSGESEPVFDGIRIIAAEPEPGDVPAEDYTGSRSRIDGPTLQRRDVSIGDVLSREVGLQRRSAGGFGSFASITVRAASPSQTSVLLDGVRLNGAGDPVIDLGMLELLSLDAIDVYRGITPIEFGAGAIGGAVALSTPRIAPQGAPLVRLGIAAGGFGYRRLEAARLARDGRWDSVLSASLNRADNDFSYVNDNGTPLNPDDDERQRRNNADARRTGLLAKLGTNHTGGARTDALLQFARRRLGVPELRNREDNRARFDTDTLQLQLRHAHRPLSRWKASHVGYAHARQDRFDDRLSQVGLGRKDTRSRSRTVGADSVWRRPLGSGSLALKAEARLESLSSQDRLGSERSADARRERLSLGGQYNAYSGDGRWVVSPALTVRNDRDRFDVERFGDGRRDVRRTHTDLVPAIGVRFDRDASRTWHASLSRYSRQPSFAELFIDRGLVQGNPDLLPERGTNLDLGVDVRFGARPVPAAAPFTRSGSASATVFASQRQEQIVTVFDAQGVGRAENAGRARVLGLELAVRLAPLPRWSVDMNMTLQDAANRSSDPIIDGRQLPGEARLSAFAALAYTPSARWRLRIEAEALRERYYDQANRRPAADSARVHASLERSTPRWRTTLALTNLGDRNVEDFNGFPRPGRSAVLSIHYTP